MQQSQDANPLCAFNPTAAGCFSGGQVITTFVAVLLGAISFGQIGPLVGSISAARAAAADIFGVIDAVPGIDVSKDEGFVPEATSEGTKDTATAGLSIEFRNVTFSYPSRPDVVVLHKFSLAIAAGEHVGIIGASGSGKSTLAALVLRAYDPQEGAVLVGGVDVKSWRLSALRERLGYVSQDPILFNASIYDNVAMGARVGVTPTREAVVACTRASNAHDFIEKLPQGYDTPAGTSVSAAQLSGGQRQRVCIARALLRDPAVMLLDEATSALDTTSERKVQAALEHVAASSSRTMLIIAHRLSTLTGVNRIVVLKAGVIVETGSPAELEAQPTSIFRAMRAAQDVSHAGPILEAHHDAGCEHSVTAAPSGQIVTSAAPSDAATHVTELARKSLSPSVAPVTAPPPADLRTRLWNLQREDWHVYLFGVLGALASGAVQPVLSIVYGNVIAVYYAPNMAANALQYLGWFVLLGVGAFVGVLCRVSVFTYLGERLTRKLRALTFEAILRQPAAFFDDRRNAVGRLTTRLATDAALVKGASGEALGSSVEGVGAIVCAIVISFTASWRLALVLMVIFPFLIIGSIFEFRSVAQVTRPGEARPLEDAGETLSEAVTGVRTVAAYNLQRLMGDGYVAALKEPRDAGYKRGVIIALGQAFQRFTIMCAYSAAFYSGAWFISNGTLAFPELIRTFLAVTLAGEAIGRISSQAPDAARANDAARSIFELLDAADASPIDALKSRGVSRPSAFTGGLRIEFKDITFAYPSRPDVPVLSNFSLVIEPGTTVGVVGASGSGKSTLALLVLRAYDPQKGSVLVDGVDVREWDVAALRSQFGLVQQVRTRYRER